jgi:hypothetical protein
LKALKKSVAQYFSSQNGNSWKSTQLPDAKLFSQGGRDDSTMRASEEPSPSFLRIMVTEQIIEEDYDKSENLDSERQKMLASPTRFDNMSPDLRSQNRSLKHLQKAPIYIQHDVSEFSLPEINQGDSHELGQHSKSFQV